MVTCDELPAVEEVNNSVDNEDDDTDIDDNRQSGRQRRSR